MKIRDSFWINGHPNIKATHRSTLEFTKDSECTPKGDCILGVKATKSIADLNEELKKYLKMGGKVSVRIVCGDLVEEIVGFGSEKLVFSDSRSVVIRKSDYVDSRTLIIKASKAARDISRELVNCMKNPYSKALVEISSIP